MTSTNYGDLSTTDLAKQINDEYAVILGSERANLQKAFVIGEMLVALRCRHSSCHGEWQPKLKLYCPKLSYETATKYIRLFTKRGELEKAAAAKSVATTDLTIDEALKLLAKPKPNKPDDSSKGKPTSVVKGAVEEPGNEPPPLCGPADRIVKDLELECGDMFEVLKQVYPQDELKELTERLARHFGMTLVPLAGLMEVLGENEVVRPT